MSKKIKANLKELHLNYVRKIKKTLRNESINLRKRESKYE